MSTPIQNVKLSFSCHEDWKEMAPCQGGKFCASCTKKVYDFTDKTQEDFEKAVLESNGDLCGRFDTEQLATRKPYFSFFKKALASTILFFGISIFETKAQLGMVIISKETTIEEELHNLANEAKFNIVLEGNKDKGEVLISYNVSQYGRISNLVILKGLNDKVDQIILEKVKSYYTEDIYRGFAEYDWKRQRALVFRIEGEEIVAIEKPEFY